MVSGRELRVEDLALTTKQMEFLNLYVEGGRTKAADCWQKVYKSCKTRKSAINAASNVLNKPHVKKFLERLTQKVAIDIELSERKVLEETAIVAFFDPLCLIEEDGTVKPMDQWPEIAGRAIKTLNFFDGKVSQIQMHDKMKAVELLGKHFKSWDRVAESNEKDLIAQLLDSLAPTVGPPSLRKPVKGTLIEHDE